MPRLIALAMPGGQLFIDELNRAWNHGDAVMPLDVRLPKTVLDKQIQMMQPAALVDEQAERHDLERAKPTEADDALVMPTSGTTGEPKGVVLTHDALRASSALTSARLGVTPHDTWLACLPVAHIGGLSVITRALHTNTPVVCLPRFDPQHVQDIARQQATLVSLVNTALQRIDASLFRLILLGGASPPPDRPANAIATYGMTESASGVVYDHYALDGVSIKADADSQLFIKSPTLLRCYRDDSDPKTADGWFPTGDAGSVDNSGYVQVFGRLDDAINTGGEKVWPTTVEQVIRTHPNVAEALVYGELDDTWGQRVVVAVEVRDPSTPPSLDELRELVKEQLGSIAAPKALYITTLERTASGKVKRLRQPRH